MHIDWNPPHTPHKLLQERFFPDRWKVAVVCITLNCTSRKQVEPIIDAFFDRFPMPESLIQAEHEAIAELIKPLGFKDRRARTLKRFSQDFIAGDWKKLSECFGIGAYAGACDEMYFEQEFSAVPPDDGALVKVWEWVTRESQAI